MRSACRKGRYQQNTQQTKETNIQIFSGARARDPSNRAVTDLRLVPHGH